MSVPDNTALFTSEGSGGDSEQIPDFDPPKKAPDRVTVDGVRIPSLGATVELRKTQSPDILGHATVKTRYEVNGVNYGQLVDTSSQSGFIPCQIALRSPLNKQGDFTPVFRGFVGGFGRTDSGKSIQFSVRDVGQILSEIPASKQFNNPSPEIPLNYVASELEEAGIFSEVNVVGVESAEENATYTSLNAASDVASIDPEMGNLGSRSFTRNRDTLADILKWVRNRSGPFRYWLRPSEDFSTLEIVVAHVDALPKIGSEYDATEVDDDGDIPLIENAALYETQIANSVVAVGSAIASRSPQALDSQWAAETPPAKFARVRAIYPDLVKRAGGTLSTRQINVDATSQRELEAAAKSHLADLLSESGRGSMTAVLSPQLMPYDRIRTLPADKAVLDADAVPLTWSVHSVVHETDPSQPIATSKLRVNFHVDELEIKIEDVDWIEAHPF